MEMKAVYSRPKYLRPMLTYYCAGCQHGIVSKLLTELAEEMDIAGNLAVCYGIGCYVAGLMNVDLDMFPALHGRGCAVATGFKRCRPEQLVITYQGDGDCASIGLGDTLQAAARGENITTIMVNNQNYGCTGGQLAPTTPLGMVTNTSPYGRSVEAQGYPIHMANGWLPLCRPRRTDDAGTDPQVQGISPPRHYIAAAGTGLHVRGASQCLPLYVQGPL